MTEHIDYETLNNLTELVGDASAVREIIDLYLDDMPKSLEALKRSIAELDAGEALKIAHAAKGSSRTVGGMRLGDLFHDLELAGKDRQVDKMPALLSAILAEFQGVETALKAYRQSLG